MDASIAVLAAVVVYSLWAGWTADEPPQEVAEIKPGQRFDVPEGLGTKPPQIAVVAALSTSCPACQQSVAFYSELAASCRKNGVPFISIFEQPEHRARGWLSLSAIQVERVYRRKLHRLGLRMTPSLILLDAESKVSSIYQGALSFSEEARVLQSVQAGKDLGSYHANSGLPALISQVQLEELLNSRSDALQLVDIRKRQEFSREHHPAAINIPGDELPIRGRIELDASRLTVVDCWKIPYHLCNRAARRFAVWGFEEITVADRGGAPCPSCKPEP